MTIRVLTGDCRDVLRTLPAGSAQCCVTSPPYFGLRDYGVAGQIGLEDTPDAFIAEMVAVFQEVRRVLADDGTLWLNLGDSYAGSWGAQSREHAGKHAPNISALSANQVKAAATRGTMTGSLGRTPGYKAKDLMMIPARVALALQADGWWLRSHIIWAKPNPMPESVTDRPTSSHESIFLLSKSARYFYDAGAVRETRTSDEDANGFRGGAYTGGNIDNGSMGARTARGNKRVGKQEDIAAAAGQAGGSSGRRMAGFNERWDEAEANGVAAGRNLRNVWTVASQPFSGAHFATFPPALIEPCIKAGSRPGDTVIDPFGGAGTTGLVADRLARDAILIELNPEYADMARRRVTDDAPLFAEIA